MYGYNDSAVGNYSAVFYVLDEITISDVSFNVVPSSTYLNGYLNVSLVHVQIPSTFLKDYSCILTQFIEPDLAKQGVVAQQYTSISAVAVIVDGYVTNIMCSFELV